MSEEGNPHGRRGEECSPGPGREVGAERLHIYSQGDENVRYETVISVDTGDATQLCEYTKNHRMMCFEMWILWFVNYISSCY